MKKNNDELPEAANQKELEDKIKNLLGPTAEEAPPSDAERSAAENATPPAEPSGPPLVDDQAAIQQPAQDEATTAVEPEKTDRTVETDSTETDDTETDEAIDDIVEKEGDTVLAADDTELEKAFTPDKPGFVAKCKRFFRSWWENKRARYLTLAALAAALIAFVAIPVTRYFFLNTVGVRGSASVTVLDDSTQLPLKNVEVSIGGKQGLTNEDGLVALSGVKLGSGVLVIQKRAFAPYTKKTTIGWGSNPLGSVALKAVGTQYVFIVKDFLSGQPIEKAQASAGDADAVSDKNGKITLTIDSTDQGSDTVTISADTYRNETAKLGTDNKVEQTVSMVPARKEAFISKRSGKFDLYKVDIDGQNEQLVLAGTGNEQQDTMVLVSHPTDEVVAYASTRENVRNSDGFLLTTLDLVDLGDNSVKKVTQSEKIQILGWIGDSLIYVKVAAGASAANPKRQRLISYDYKSGIEHELASSNYFNDVALVGDSVYYAPSSAYQSGTAGFYKTDATGATKQTIISQEVWNIFRTAYDTLTISVGNDWYEYKVGSSSNKPTKLSGAPADLKNRIYIDNADKSHSLWVDDRDGKGVLISYDVNAKVDKVLRTQAGLNNPLRWLSNDTAIFRIHTDQETADYAISINGGDAKKIRDVTNTSGIDQWYYY